MTLLVTHKKTEKSFYLTDVVRLHILEIGPKSNQELIYRIKRKYKRGEETVTEDSAIRGEEYRVDAFEEGWTND